ncbi:hypothetical protein EsH8_IV_001103 [Colletotrichum jinshuiense]
MPNHHKAVSANGQRGDDQSRFTHGEERCVRLRRPGSPYPHTNANVRPRRTSVTGLLSSSPLQVLSERNTNKKVQNKAPSSDQPSSKPSGSTQRNTSIRWATNLPVPDRRLTPSLAFNEATSSPEARRVSFQYNDYELYGEPFPRAPEYNEYIDEQRAYEAGKKSEKARKKRVTRLAKRQLAQDSEDTMDFIASNQHSFTAGYIPPHKRTTNVKANIGSQDLNTTGYEAESDTESSGDYLNPRIPPSEAAKKPDPLTPTALKTLPERLGVGKGIKKSHSSWDVSVDDESTSSDERVLDHSNNSNNTSGEVVEDFIPGPASPWLAGWLTTLSINCKASFLEDKTPEHQNYGVDPATGKLMNHQIEQPPTFIDIEEVQKMKPAMVQRRRDWTSNLIIQREISIRKNLMRRQQEEMKREIHVQPVTMGWEQIRTESSMNTAKPAQAFPLRQKKVLNDCVLRSGQPTDAKACAEIYNMIGTDNLHTADANSVSALQFKFILNECSAEKLPFVVAAFQKADLCDASNWPSLDAYRQYMQWKQSQPQETSLSEPTIYGFAFLAPYERGIGGGPGIATQTVKATVFVHPEHRRSGVGSALLHRLLSQTSILYHGNVKYKWNDPDAVEDSFHKPGFRDVHRIIVHSIAKTEGEQNLKWMDNFMMSFQFEKAGRLNQVYKVDKPHGAEWYDQIVWQHWANKIDTHRTFFLGDESECSYDYPGKSRSPEVRRVQYPQDGDNGECRHNSYNSDDIFGR